MTDLDERLRAALSRTADDAPPVDGLAEGARRLHRARRRGRLASLASALAVVAVVGPVVVIGRDRPADVLPQPAPGSVDESPSTSGDGWRVETWRGIRVQVPASWQAGVRSMWCLSGGLPDTPLVQRPGTSVGAIHVDCIEPVEGFGLTFGSSAAISLAYPSGHVWQYEKGDVEMYVDGSWLGYWYDDEERMISVNAGDRETVQQIIDSVAEADDGWATAEHGGVTVDLPPGWAELDQSGCRWPWPRFGPRSSNPCDPRADGFTFYNSATFDPFEGPGLRRSHGGWVGYVLAGEYAISINAADKEVAQRVLDSAVPPR